MEKRKAKKTAAVMVISGILVLALALGVTSVFAQSDQEPETPPEAGSELPVFHPGKRGFAPGQQVMGRGANIEMLAEELGVDAEALQNALVAARDAAREDGVLPAPFQRGEDNEGLKAELEGYLSDALAEIGVTVDELLEAQEAVKEAVTADLLDRGIITEEQMALREAREALKGYIDRKTLMADVAESLGIELPDADDDESPRMSRQALMEQLEEKGLTMLDVTEAMHAAYEDAIADAAAEGIITDEQADLILEADTLGMNPMQRGFGCRGQGGPRGARPRGGFGFQNSNPAPTGASL